MAIKVSGVNVIDNERNASVGVATATSIDVPPVITTFSPADGASDIALDRAVFLTYNTAITKGTGNITFRDGSASGTVLETIDVTSGAVTISGGQATINPSDFPTGTNIYVVIDEGCFKNAHTFYSNSVTKLVDTYNFTTGPITTSSFSPSDGATGQSISTNIVITFSENITKETTAATKYITLRAGSASGTVRQTIDVSTSAVSVSGNQATINPPSDLEYSEDTYVVVDENSFFNSDGDASSGNDVINTYNFTTEADILGTSMCGGYLICAASNNYWIVSPSSAEVSRSWHQRSHANTRAQSVSGCSGWFVPSCAQFANPGNECKTYWDDYTEYRGTYWEYYWTDTELGGGVHARLYRLVGTGGSTIDYRDCVYCVRAFRCVSY